MCTFHINNTDRLDSKGFSKKEQDSSRNKNTTDSLSTLAEYVQCSHYHCSLSQRVCVCVCVCASAHIYFILVYISKCLNKSIWIIDYFCSFCAVFSLPFYCILDRLICIFFSCVVSFLPNVFMFPDVRVKETQKERQIDHMLPALVSSPLENGRISSFLFLDRSFC